MTWQEEVVSAVQNVLSPDLLGKTWRQVKTKRPFAGHCYMASEAIYYLAAKANGFSPMRVEVMASTDKGGHWWVSHWYLKNRETQEIIDATAEQFKSKVPYKEGRYCGF